MADLRTRGGVIGFVGGLMPELVGPAERSLRPSVRFEPIAPGSPAALWFGGGGPLPTGVAWPELERRPLHLITTVDLSMVADHDLSGSLPVDGMLLFFYDAVRQPWGFDPSHRDGWSVIYVAANEAANTEQRFRVAHALDAEFMIPAVLAERRFGAAYTQWTLPKSLLEDLDEDELDLDDDELNHQLNHVDEALERNLFGDFPQMLGWPSAIQRPMERQCQLVSNGIGNGGADEDPRASELEAGKRDWRLLLQVPSWDPIGGANWGDHGMLYFWILEQDLAACRFDRVWTILQCM